MARRDGACQPRSVERPARNCRSLECHPGTFANGQRASLAAGEVVKDHQEVRKPCVFFFFSRLAPLFSHCSGFGSVTETEGTKKEDLTVTERMERPKKRKIESEEDTRKQGTRRSTRIKRQ